MTHRDAVVDRDRVELAGNTASLRDRIRDDAADGGEVGVAGHELGERVGDRDDRLAANVGAGNTGGTQQCAGASHIAAMGNGK